MGDQQIAIISAPDADESQVTSLVYALEAEGKLPFPVYITKAKLNPISKEDVLDWFETLAKVCVKNGWGKDVSDRLKTMQDEE